jgi:hypothetical protein
VFRASGRATAGAARAIQTAPGSLWFVAALFGSAVGWLLAFAIAALHVSGEWSRGSAASSFAANPDRRLFLLAKTMSVFLTLVIALLITTSLLEIVNLTYLHRFVVAIPHKIGDAGGTPFPADPTRSSWQFALGRLGLVAPILIVFSAAAVSVAAIVRRPLASLAAGAGALAVLYATARLGGVGPYTPMAAVSQILDFAGSPWSIHDHLGWIAPGARTDLIDVPHPVGQPAQRIGTGVAALAVVLAASWARFARMDRAP